MNAQVEDLMRDVEALVAAQDEHTKRFLRTRIEIAAAALLGQERPVDSGPWSVSSDGKIIESDCFDHDVMLRVNGDFYGDEDRVAYSRRLAEVLNGAKELRQGLPKEPPAGLLWSMAMRLRHDFGLDADDNSPMACGFTPAEREVMLADMRKLYEEVSGHGFFRWKDVTGSQEG